MIFEPKAIAHENVMRNHRVVDLVARQVTENFNITGSNRFDLAIEEVEERVMAPGVPSLVLPTSIY